MSEDTIYRQSAIEAVSEACEECRGTFARCEEKLQALPSAQPRPRGKWKNPTVIAIRWTCSVCKNTAISRIGKLPSHNFCPNCGADMREEVQNDRSD